MGVNQDLGGLQGRPRLPHDREHDLVLTAGDVRWNGIGSDLGHARQTAEGRFAVARGAVLASPPDAILDAIAECEVAIGPPPARVTGMKPEVAPSCDRLTATLGVTRNEGVHHPRPED